MQSTGTAGSEVGSVTTAMCFQVPARNDDLANSIPRRDDLKLLMTRLASNIAHSIDVRSRTMPSAKTNVRG